MKKYIYLLKLYETMNFIHIIELYGKRQYCNIYRFYRISLVLYLPLVDLWFIVLLFTVYKTI